MRDCLEAFFRADAELHYGGQSPPAHVRSRTPWSRGPPPEQAVYGQPAAKRFRKQLKSLTFSTGGAVLASQLA